MGRLYKNGFSPVFAMKDFHFELCVESLEAALAAEAGGATRVELCSELSIGGVTPSFDMMAATVKTLSIPVYVLIRPRGGDFIFSADEIDAMPRQVEAAKQAGAAGVVVGMLRADGRVDVERSRALVELAYPMKATFHRAFDETPDQSEALEAVIETGVDCLLTSGGAPDVLAGAESIARLCEQAAGRLDVMAGGGLTLATLVEVVRRTGVSLLHGSLTRKQGQNGGTQRVAPGRTVLESDVREAIRLFRQEIALRDNSAMTMR